ncbi:MAG: CoA transferase [Betaproteobacteria bacterium]|nr:CoA transferase [Betaproteobacteria bacterium]
MTTVLMGPYATLILADLGADIIKIESPEGDVSRQSTPARSPKMGHAFLNCNRNKRSVVLDLKHPGGRSALLKLAERADALIYSVRPQAMTRLKLGYDDFKAVNPQIIYIGAVGFSQRGRYSGRPAYDDVIQGMAGVPWMAARASGQAPRYAPNAYADRVSSLHVALAVVGALYHRKCTGHGQSVEVPMFENLVHLLLGEHLEGETFIPARGPMGHPRALSPERRPYRTKDGFLCTLVYNDKQWRAFFKMIGQPERFEDPRFSSQVNRIKNIDAVYGFLSEILQTRTTEEWTKLFMENDLPVGPMNSLEDVLNDPHLADVGYFTPIVHPTEGSLRAMYYPTEFSEAPVTSRYPAPRLGQHTVELLAEAGYEQSRIDELIVDGIVTSPPSK